MIVEVQNRQTPPSSFMMRMAMRVSRSRWFVFLRRVFHYQNGSRSNLGSNPFDSSTWMLLELMALLVQLGITTFTLAISKNEQPVWPMRLWIVGYDIGCLLSLLVLYGRCRQVYAPQRDSFTPSDLEQQLSSDESRSSVLMNKCRTSLELFFAIWFVMGNVWMFDSRLGSFNRAPKLHVVCISLLTWNAITYSFPFLLFVLLCICVPVISNILGYNMNMGSSDKGASEDEISALPSWKYMQVNTNLADDDPECCICLAKYKDNEEVRQLPCSHIFHLNCVDQWLNIITCCPLCKQELKR